ncbi:Helix-turn-helix domain containing protein [uncultured Caudovirales phage]|uniref:Helix-turn-helix domain containing protein n=1 Tax=uncultured Caudovirales phage TaxID=2100421 RepID=A0A6J5QX12_9CAUD|nr:Helix-turn-helix domain containing protein [uncultured Caudovirales phage]CAB4216940.1 Helix-turn-helix domain containing protein [uncultured Caudovirales phage]
MIQAIAMVLDFAPVHWSPSTRMVAIALADYANTDTGHCWPSIANLARRSGLSLRQVQRCLREIETEGWIERDGVHRVGTNLWIWRKRFRVVGDTHVTPPVTPVSPPHRGTGVTPVSPEPLVLNHQINR